MTARKTHHCETTPGGAIDLMYFPPARRTSAEVPSDTRCQEPIDPVVQLKQESHLGYVFITQCKRWTCDRRIYCEDTHLDDVLRYTLPYPQHFIGIAAYNPLDISASIQQAETGIRHHGFRGVYVHPGSFGVSLSDRRMYPVYVKSLDWRVPLMVDLRSLPGNSQAVRPSAIEQVAGDFPELTFVIAAVAWTEPEMLRLIDNLPNLYFCFDTAALSSPEVVRFLDSPAAHSRCTWGSNGVPWKESLASIDQLGLACKSELLHGNATQIFRLDHLKARKPRPFVQSEEPPIRIIAE